MYIKDCLTNGKIYFSQETMGIGSRMIVLEDENNTIELYCTIDNAKKLANDLLKSIEIFEQKYKR